VVVSKRGCGGKVLASEIALGVERPDIEVKNVSNQETSGKESVFLRRDGEKVELSLKQGDQERTMDVTGYVKELVEVQADVAPESVKIANSGSDFLISQKGVSARTSYSIYIDPTNREISLETPSGKKYLNTLPYEAVLGVIKANVLSKLNSNNEVSINEQEGGELLYYVSGEKVLNLVNLVEYSVPVNASVSVSTGQVVKVDEPVWLKVLGFLFA
jgi:hypothetical protein